MTELDLTNHLLIATPALTDPNFQQSVAFVCAHNDEGAMGIIINRPTNISLGEILSQMDLSPEAPEISEIPVFEGGPVHRDRGFIIHRPSSSYESTINVSNELGVSTSRDILEAISRGNGPNQALVALGYAGWGAGQLESELAENAWLPIPVDLDIVFETPPEKRWHHAGELLGIDISALSHPMGHA